MNNRTAWTMAVAALVVGLGAGTAATYLLIRPRGAESAATDKPLPPQEGRRPEAAPSSTAAPLHQLLPAEVRAGDVLGAGNFLGAKSCEIRGFDVAFYYVTESNSYKGGHSDIASSQGIAPAGQRLTLVAARQPPPGTRLLPAFLGIPGGSMAMNLPEDDFTGGRVVVGHWGIEKPLDLRIGQSATIFQFGTVDGTTGSSAETELRFDRDPLAEFKPLRRMSQGENQVARLSVRVMRMDPSWTLDSPEVKQFLDFRTAMRRAAGGGN